MTLPGRRIRVQGTVQGVGFRPWVYRLAREAGLAGSVRNDAAGVTIEAFGEPAALDAFEHRLAASPPPAAAIDLVRAEPLAGSSPAGFEIAASGGDQERRVSIPPDLAVCDDCRREVADPADRRHRYPFTNCTNCGPRFTITLDVPYDRPATTMAGFAMCPDCRREYEDPADRRFHAQPNACPVCGPHLALWDAGGGELARGEAALRRAGDAVRRGEIVAVKGLGGFHLLVDARNGLAVDRLRHRKRRWQKPLALMVPDLAAAGELCELPATAAELLASPRAPIVLLRRRPDPALAEPPAVAPAVAPDNPDLGIMLPYTPLHALLLADLRRPLVATSGNVSDEPICTDEREAVRRLGEIADLFLVHDRPIARHADDSVVAIVAGAPRLVRRARGWAPSPLPLGQPVPPLLAVGAHLKNTVAVATGSDVFVSQHVGDMETSEAYRAFEAVIADLLRMCRVEPVAIAHDLHPDYAATRWAREAGIGGDGAPGALADACRLPVQHHHAHLASCLVDAGVAGPALGVTWDGTGLGTDGTVWGGEFLAGDAAGFRRVARLRPFRLPGGDAAVREPRRVALALLWELVGERAFADDLLPPLRDLGAGVRRPLLQMLATGFRAPVTTSAGRLFDGVAALAGLHQRVSFEGQAAIALEHAAEPALADAYPFAFSTADPSAPEDAPELIELDWRPLIAAVVEDVRSGTAPGVVAARFHNALVAAIVEVARRIGEPRVALTGGCFQNRRLTEGATAALATAGFEVLLHRRVPTSDGGISLGQIAVAAARLAAEPEKEV